MRPRSTDVAMGIFALAAAGLLLWAGRDLTFFFDEWRLLLDPDPLTPSSLISPHNEQIFVVPHLVYGVGLELFGMSSQLPYRALGVLASSACVILLYLYIRRRTSPGMALVMTGPALVVGAAWETLLLPLSMSFTIGLAAGLGMLLALESGSRRGDLAACLLLVVSLASGGIGLAFAAGAAVDLALKRDLRRSWLLAGPLLLVGLWQLGAAGQGPGIDLVDSLAGLPRHVYDASLAAVGAVSGGNREFISGLPGALINATLLAGVAARFLWAGKPVSPAFPVVAAVLLSFWVLGGLAAGAERSPEASRYQFPAAVLLLAVAASLLAGLRLPPRLPLALVPLAVVSVALSVGRLTDGRDFLVEQTEITRAAIGQIEIEGPGPGYWLTEEVTGSRYQQLIESNAYLRAAGRFGSPAPDPAGTEATSGPARRAADGVVMAAAIARAAAQPKPPE